MFFHGSKKRIEQARAAVQSDDVATLQAVLSKLPAEDRLSSELLELALKRRSHSALGVLMEFGVDVNANLADLPAPPLHIAAILADAVAVKLLLDAGASVDRRAEENDGTPLHSLASNAAMAGQQREQGALKDDKAYGRSYSEYMDDVVRVIDLLLAAGADINAKASGGFSPLAISIQDMGSDATVANALIDRDASFLEEGASSDGNTPLHWAAYYGHQQVLSRMAEMLARKHGREHVDLEIRGECGSTPLAMACQEGRIEIVRYLISHGWVRPPFKADDDGRDPIFEASRKGHSEIVSYLSKHVSP